MFYRHKQRVTHQQNVDTQVLALYNRQLINVLLKVIRITYK